MCSKSQIVLFKQKCDISNLCAIISNHNFSITRSILKWSNLPKLRALSNSCSTNRCVSDLNAFSWFISAKWTFQAFVKYSHISNCDQENHYKLLKYEFKFENVKIRNFNMISYEGLCPSKLLMFEFPTFTFQRSKLFIWEKSAIIHFMPLVCVFTNHVPAAWFALSLVFHE